MKLRPIGKKGITISMPTIIITVLAILVLLIVALSFTGGMRTLIDQVKKVFGVTTEPPIELAKDRCKTLCTLQRVEAYCAGVDIAKTGGQETEHFDCFNIAPCEGISEGDCPL